MLAYQRKEIHQYPVLSPILSYSPPNQSDFADLTSYEVDLKHDSLKQFQMSDSAYYGDMNGDSSDNLAPLVPPPRAFTTPIQDSLDLYKSRDEKLVHGVIKVHEPTKGSGGFTYKVKKIFAKLRKNSKKKKAAKKRQQDIEVVVDQAVLSAASPVVEEEKEVVLTPLYCRMTNNSLAEDLDKPFSYSLPELSSSAYEIMKLCDQSFFGRSSR